MQVLDVVLQAAALQSAANGIVITDRIGTIVWANPAFTTLTGYPLEDAFGQNLRILRSGRHGQSFYSNLWATILTGSVWQGEIINRRKDGSLYTEEMTVTPFRAEGNEVTHFIAIKRDVTERQRSQEALEASETRYRRLFETAKDGILILDPETGQINDVNPFLIEMLGYTHREITGRKLWEVGPFRDIPASRTAFAELRTKGFIRYEHLPLQTKDGRRCDVEFVSNVYTVDDSQVAQCNIRDITERKRAEEALRKSEEEYRLFFQSNLAGNYISTPDGKLLACNSAFARILGFASIEEALKQNLASLYPDPRAREAFVDAVRNHGQLEHTARELRRPDGRPAYVIESAIGKLDEHSELAEILGYLIDETERRRAEEQLRQAQKMNAVGRLAGGIAHDFNNLLGIIMGYAEIMLERVKSADPLREDAEQILEATKRGAALTSQLLAFSRQQVLHPTVLDLNKLLIDLGKMLPRLIGEDIELTMRLAPELGRVKADQNQIEQVIFNLAVNARDAMPAGGRLLIETSNAVVDEGYIDKYPMPFGGYVLLTVSDTGVGIDEALRARVFEPFFTTKAFGKGFGLGLAIVYGVVKQSGGFIWLDSEPGMGTTFKIYLPYVQEEASIVGAEHVPHESHEGRETVLLVEDEKSLRKVGRAYLEDLGYSVLEANNGLEALQVAKRYRGPIHLLITDVVMPKMGGRELAERLFSARGKLPVIYVSGYSNGAIVGQGVLEPGLTFLQKPVSLRDLASKIREVLGKTSNG